MLGLDNFRRNGNKVGPQSGANRGATFRWESCEARLHVYAKVQPNTGPENGTQIGTRSTMFKKSIRARPCNSMEVQLRISHDIGNFVTIMLEETGVCSVGVKHSTSVFSNTLAAPGARATLVKGDVTCACASKIRNAPCAGVTQARRA